MAASLFGTGNALNANVNGSLVPQSFTATAGQTLFILTSFTYTPNSGSLLVFINGQKQTVGRDYTETSSTSLTFIEGCVVGDYVDVLGFPATTLDYSGLLGVFAANTGAAKIGTASGRTQEAKNSDFYSAKDAGAKGDGVTDDYLAIQTALNTGRSVYLPGATAVYLISQKLRFKYSGQRLIGEGSGDGSVGVVTRLKYIGTAGVTGMVSVYPGSGSHLSNCWVENLCLDGNALANKGFEGYDDSVTGGAWRNGLCNVFITGVTYGANPTGTYLGTTGNAPDFAHDFCMYHTYITGTGYGVQGKGAIYTLVGKCTIQACTIAGVYGYSGSAWNLGDTVFTGNVRDIDMSNPQQVSALGAWFENSTAGIYRCNTAHSLHLLGCYFHTNYATLMFDMGSSAGVFELSGDVSNTTVSSLVKNINGTYGWDISNSNLTSENGIKKRIIGYQRTDNGRFAASITTDQNAVTGDGTVVNLNAVAYTAEYNFGLNLNTATGVYTCAVTGNHEFRYQLHLSGLTASHTDLQFNLIVGGQAYSMSRLNPGAVRTATNELEVFASKEIALNLGQTAYVQVMVSGGTKVVNILAGAAGTNYRNRFEGKFAG